MKLSRWITLVLIVLIMATAAFILLRRYSVHKLSIGTVAPVSTGNVTFQFLECAGKRSVFVLNNQTREPIYARVQRVDYWKEYKDANIQLGVHLVKYRAPNAADFVDRSAPWDAPIPFKIIPVHTSVRYGVDLDEQTGLYKVAVPYMETKDTDLVKRMNQGIHAVTKEDFKRLETAWKEAWSEPNPNKCQ